MKKRIILLGSTGSIGRQTLDVIRHHLDRFEIVALSAGSNIKLLSKQVQEFKPKAVSIEKGCEMVRQRFPKLPIVSINELVQLPDGDMVVVALSGAAGICPVLSAIEAKKEIGLANKEAIVAAGELVMERAKEKGVTIVPIDSEHSALFQCLMTGKKSEVDRLILTASGGPFLHQKDLSQVTICDALKHPTWSMGKKITVDSSTLMNKGLEVIEAHHLFGVPVDQIDVVIHPQSIVHSIVQWCDGSMVAQMSMPSMLLPIQFALSYPKRIPSMMGCFDWGKSATLNFFEPDTQRFRCLKLALSAARTGQSMPCFMNGANEVLVQRFCDGEIRWQEIAQKLETLMERHQTSKMHTLDDVLGVDKDARALAKKC